MRKKYYYDSNNFKLILGDSLKELKKIEPNSITLPDGTPLKLSEKDKNWGNL